jgi:hypothetical protein
MLTPTKRTRERILAIGSFGVGKSRAWLTIAARAQKSGSKARFYCLDTDHAIERMIDEGFPELNNVEVANVFEWPEYEGALKRFLKVATPDDWLICDMIDAAWDAAQAYYVDEIFSKDIGQYFIEARKVFEAAKKEKGKSVFRAFDGWQDWPVIKKVYFSWLERFAKHAPCHVFATAKVEPIDTEKDSKELIKTYGPYGVRPKGQKDLGHSFHTILFLQKAGSNDYRFTTIKDRERKEVEGEKLTDFVLQYLVPRAKWKL